MSQDKELEDKLIEVFYLLMRDEIPVGVLVGLVELACKRLPDGVTYTNHYLEGLSRSLVTRLSGY